MIKTYKGIEECNTCTGNTNEWYAKTGEIGNLICFGEIENGIEISKYYTDMSNGSFYFVQFKNQENDMPKLVTYKDDLEDIKDNLYKIQKVLIFNLDSTIIFEMEGKGKIIFHQI